MLYRLTDYARSGDQIEVYAQVVPHGVHVRTNSAGCSVPDDEIPGLVAALQNYMTRRAHQITRGAGK